MPHPCTPPRPTDTAAPEAQAAQQAVAALEHHLAQLAQALRNRQLPEVLGHADALPQALGAAAQALLALEGRDRGTHDQLQRRMGAAHSQLTRQRQALARAAAVLDRALGPVWAQAQGADAALYTPEGRAASPRAAGRTQA